MAQHTLHPVSCKVALYTDRGRKILLLRRVDKDNLYILPGGHLELHETPEEAVRRELREETGLEVSIFVGRNFWINELNSNLILGFTASIDSAETPTTTLDYEIPEWISVTDLPNLHIVGSYRDFILANVPN